jgi:CBS domain containing-hemolysin-like protein
MQVVTDARAKLAIVVSGTRPVGIVTVKDLIEPLTGEFRAW